MSSVCVAIVKFVDENFPGWVECRLVDAAGQEHRFVEKVPVVSNEVLWTDSSYPRVGTIACEVVEQWQNEDGRAFRRIDTQRPWAIESVDGKTSFVVLASQIVAS